MALGSVLGRESDGVNTWFLLLGWQSFLFSPFSLMPPDVSSNHRNGEYDLHKKSTKKKKKMC
jgi:hypothetical protein